MMEQDQDDQDLSWDEPPDPEQLARKRRIVRIGVLLGVVALAAVAAFFYWNRQVHLSEQAYLARAESFLKAGQLSAAVIELKNATQASPRNPQTRLLLADAYLKQGLGAEAAEQLNQARGHGAASSLVTLPLAEALLLQRKYEKVLQEIRPDAPELAGERPRVLRIRADALLGLGKPQEACPLFRQSLGADPKYVPAYWGLAKCALAGKDFAGARAQLAAALELEPRNVRSLVLQGDVAQAMGDLPGAEAAYGQALALDANSLAARLSRVSVRLAAGKLDLAAEDVKVAKARAADSVMVRYLEALVAYRQDRLTDAHNLLLELTAKAPDHAPSRVLAGYVAYRLGQYRLAESNLTGALLSLPESRIVRLTLARSRLKTGQPEGALAVLGSLLAGEARDPEVLTAAGEAHQQMGNHDKAAEYLEKAAALVPGDPGLRARLGLWRMRSGDLPGAVRELESAARLGVLPEQAEIWRVMTHLMRKEYDQALAQADALARRFPNHAPFHHLKGKAYLGKGDAAGARESFERALKLQPLDIAAAKSLAQLDLRQGKVGAAGGRYEAMLKHDPRHYEAMMELAQLAKAQGRGADQVRWLTGAAEAARGETTPRLLLARHFLAKNEPAKALTWARQAHDLNSRNPKAMELLGDVQLATGDKDSAVYTYLQWTLIDQKSPEAYYKLGKARLAAGHTLSARESLQRALQRRPGYVEAAMALAQLELQDRRPKVALELARQIAQQHPGLWQAYALQGDSHAGLGRHAEAAKAYGQAVALRHDSGLFIRLHQALTRSGEARQAEQVLAQWLQKSPNDLAVRLYLGSGHLQAGRAREAMAEYQAVLKITPDNLAALVGMAVALHAQNDARAVRYAELAYEKGGRSAALSAQLGLILVARGEIRRGLELLRQAEALEPENPAIRYHLAAALARTGEQAQARRLLEALLAKAGEFPQRAGAQALLKTLPAAKAQGRP